MHADSPQVEFEAADAIRPLFGRGLLASSHAGTRLPIAECSITGRSPSDGPYIAGQALLLSVSSMHIAFLGRSIT